MTLAANLRWAKTLRPYEGVYFAVNGKRGYLST